VGESVSIPADATSVIVLARMLLVVGWIFITNLRAWLKGPASVLPRTREVSHLDVLQRRLCSPFGAIV
jgi:hypothetical protein